MFKRFVMRALNAAGLEARRIQTAGTDSHPIGRAESGRRRHDRRRADIHVLHDVVRFMADHGYIVYDVGDAIRRPHDGALGLLDLFFARAGGVLHTSNAWE